MHSTTWSAGLTQSTFNASPDISAAINDVVEQPGWVSGNCAERDLRRWEQPALDLHRRSLRWQQFGSGKAVGHLLSRGAAGPALGSRGLNNSMQVACGRAASY